MERAAFHVALAENVDAVLDALDSMRGEAELCGERWAAQFFARVAAVLRQFRVSWPSGHVTHEAAPATMARTLSRPGDEH
ncbi:MAG: hypothetical protein PVJ57_03650 [Phycisphaerae bacterium]|jgi:hypothetical protein